ncbi:hypothetical protein [Treponema berlinense]|uniref:hypothetical protein n=1 Tax=Treponema berlinense TaxID=225004 RepID=UPI003FD70CC4
MAKKSSFNLFYLIGMIAVIVGSFLPIIRISLGILGKIDFTIVDAFKDLSNLDSWLALLMFVAAAVGVILCFVKVVSNASMLKTVCLLASIVLGLIFFARGNFFKDWFKITGFGFYIILAGWVIGLIGTFVKK